MTEKNFGTQSGDRMLIGIIADEDTTMGFLLAGIGEVVNKITNYEIVCPDTPVEVIESAFERLYTNINMGVILIGNDVRNKIAHSILEKHKRLPIILELPPKNTLNLVNKNQPL